MQFNGNTLTAFFTAVNEEAAPVIINSAEGNPVNLLDSAERKCVDLKIDIYAQQAGEGVASPDNIRPISGVDRVALTICGKNLLNIKNLGYVAGIGHNEADNIFGMISSTKRGTHYMPCLPNTTYTFSKSLGTYLILLSSVDIPDIYVPVTTYASGHDGVNTATITTGSNDRYLCFYLMRTTEEGVLTYEQILATCQLEIGTYSTAYEAHQEETITLDLPDTCYGGYVDWTASKCPFTHNTIVLNGTEAFYSFSAGKFVTYELQRKGKADGDVLCSHYKSAKIGDNRVGLYSYGLCINDTTHTTSEETWRAYLAEQYANGTPVTIAYERETPLEHGFAEMPELHMLYPVTNILTDCKGVSVKYVADTKNYIDNQITDLKNAILASGANV